MSNTNTAEMITKLKAAGEKAETAKAIRRERVVKGSHLTTTLLDQAKAAGVLAEEKSGFVKLSAGVKGKNLYIAKKGGRVDLSGFTVEAAAVRQVSETEAKEKHLGKVRGQLDFEQADEAVLAAFTAAVGELKTPNPDAPVKGPRAKKLSTKPDAEATQEGAEA